MNNKEELLEIIRKSYRRETDYLIVSHLPDFLSYKVNPNKLTIRLECNVDEFAVNYKSLEGWFLILYRWGIFDIVEFEWKVSKYIAATDYEIFLKRIILFENNFNQWFSISDINKKEMTKFSYEEINDVSVNVIIESIINTVWGFEMNETIDFKFPDIVILKFSASDLILNFNKESCSDSVSISNDSNFAFRIESIIQRWSYLRCVFNNKIQVIDYSDEQEDLYSKLLEVGYNERNLAVPYIINN